LKRKDAKVWKHVNKRTVMLPLKNLSDAADEVDAVAATAILEKQLWDNDNAAALLPPALRDSRRRAKAAVAFIIISMDLSRSI